MAMAFHSPTSSTALFPTNPFTKRTFNSNPHLHFPSHRRKRIPLVASASPGTSPSPSPINLDYLSREFGGQGVTFEGVGGDCVVKMGLEDGSSATMMLPSGLITSYKPHMWHGSTVEVLHTSVTEGKEGQAVVLGGVSPAFRFGGGQGGFCWAPTAWAIRDVNGSSEKSVQLELISVDPESSIEFKYVITLKQELLGLELMITNLKSSPVQFLGLVSSHLKVSTPDATYAFGLQGSNYVGTEPLQSGFSIIPPDNPSNKSSSQKQSWGQKALQGMLYGWGRTDERTEEVTKASNKEKEELEGEEEENCTPMTKKFSRLYTFAPREFTILDRGRRNSVIIERRGFDEFYVYSPGSKHDWYGKYAYVCIGPSAMLTPVELGPQQVWYGGQYLHNPNL